MESGRYRDWPYSALRVQGRPCEVEMMDPGSNGVNGSERRSHWKATVGLVAAGILMVAGTPGAGGQLKIHGVWSNPPSCTAWGIVFDPNRHPMEYLTVTPWEIRSVGAPSLVLGQVAETGITSSDGSYEARVREPPAPMSGLLMAWQHGFPWGWASWDMKTNRKINIMVAAPVPLRGRVTDANGGPVRDALVHVRAIQIRRNTGEPNVLRIAEVETQGLLFARRTDQDGRFSFTPVPMGIKVELAVEKDGWDVLYGGDQTSASPTIIAAGTIEACIVMTPVAGDRTQARITGTAPDRPTTQWAAVITRAIPASTGGGTSICGTVRDESGTPVAGSAVRILGVTATDGITGLDGRFQLQFDLRNYQAGTPVCIEARSQLLGLIGTVVADPTCGSADVDLGPGMTLTGQVADPNGVPLPGASLSLRLQFPGGFTRVQTLSPPAQDGRFTVAQIPKVEQCSLTVICPDRERRVVDVHWRKPGEGTCDLGRIVMNRSY
jgi:protocatechuate 3,4-dioxygenase beta subunit